MSLSAIGWILAVWRDKSCSLLAVIVSSMLWSYLYCPSRAVLLSLQTSLEERIPSSFDIWNPDLPTCPSAQQECCWLFGRVTLSKLCCNDFPLLHSAIIPEPKLLLLVSRRPNKPQRGWGVHLLPATHLEFLKYSKEQEFLLGPALLCEIWMASHHHFLWKSPDLPT